MNKAAHSHLRSVPTGQPTEADLVRCAAEGDRSAFAALFRKHARYVAGVVYRIMRHPGEVDDVVQDTFIAAHRGLSGLDEPAAFRRWVVTIAIRQVHKRLALRKKNRALDEELSHQFQETTNADIASRIDDLYEALEEIDPQIRIPWLLARLEGHTLPDVAIECDISLATTKRRIARADECIRRRLDHG